MSKTNYLEAAVINYFLRPAVGAPARPAALYVGLLTAVSDDETPSLTEAAYTGYARGAATFSDPGSTGQTSNTGVVSNGTASGTIVAITHFFIADAASGGNILYVGALTTPKTPASGDPVEWAIGALVVQEL